MGGKYKIKVISASNLEKADTFSESDPYVKIFTDMLNTKTSIIRDNKDPEWNESFELPWTREEEIDFKVFDFDSKQDMDDPIGHAKVDLSGWTVGQKQQFTLKLEACKSGELKVEIERTK